MVPSRVPYNIPSGTTTPKPHPYVMRPGLSPGATYLPNAPPIMIPGHYVLRVDYSLGGLVKRGIMLLPVTQASNIRWFYFPRQRESLEVKVHRVSDMFGAMERLNISNERDGMEYLMTQFSERVVIPSSCLEKVDEVLRDTKPFFDEYAYRKAWKKPIFYPGIRHDTAVGPMFLPIATRLKHKDFDPESGLRIDHDFDTYSEAFQERIERSKSRDSAFTKLFWRAVQTDSMESVRDRLLDVEWSDREDRPYRETVEEKRKEEDSSELTHKKW